MQKVFSEGDIFWFFLPVRTELGRALAQGQVPLWSPSLQAGFPLFAEGQIAALYPLNVMFYRLLPVEYALSISILLNFAWASLGMYILVRASGFRIPSALLAGLVFGRSGFMTAHLPHVSLVAVAAWLPWLILFQQKYWQAKVNGTSTRVWFLAICISTGLQLLAGYPPIALLNIAAFVLFGMVNPFLRQSRLNKPVRDWITNSLLHSSEAAFITLLSILLGVGIAAIQLLPLAEFAGLSGRGQEVGIAFFTSYSLDPSALTQLLSPFWYLGQPSAANMEFWAYLGVLPLALAFLAPLARRDTRTWTLLSLALISLFLALGGFNPVYNWLYYVPVFDRFRAPARFLFLFTFAAAFLAATSFEELQRRLPDFPRGRWRSPIVVLALLATAAAVIVLAYSQPLEFWMSTWRWLPAFFILLSITVLLIARFHPPSRIIFSAMVIGLTVFDLETFSAVFLSNLTQMTSPADLVQVPRTVQAMDSHQNNYRILVNRFPSVTQPAVRATLWPDLALQYGKQGVGVYAPLELQRAKEYVGEMTLPMLNLMNVRYYLLPLQTAPPGDPSPFDETEPYGGLTLGLLSQQPAIPPTPAARLEIVSYTDQSANLPDGFLAGELTLTLSAGKPITLPIRLGQETADWAYNGLAEIGKVDHSKPAEAISFPAYLASVGHAFQGEKYVAHYDLGSEMTISAVGVKSFLPHAELTVESVSLIDAQGHAVSLAALLHRNDLALAFRSHTAAMWENKDVLPRAFIVHAAEVVKDEDALAQMKQPNFQPAETALLSDGTPLDAPNGAGQARADEQATIAEYHSERVVINAKVDKTGYLILTDSWYPGWVATVDGKDAPIQRADYIFRAVALKPGNHTIVFEYHPASFAWGALISASSLIVLLVITFVKGPWMKFI